MIDRPVYIDFLKKWKDKDVIKVVTGIRRCGKSAILSMYRDYLLSQGVKQSQIISINFEDPAFEGLCDYKPLYDYLSKRLSPKGSTYIFLDEIQHVSSYEKVVDGLYIKEGVDIYITGSNSEFLSGELSSLLSGRFVELKMLPLSFKEYVNAKPSPQRSVESCYRDYLFNSSFPYACYLEDRGSVLAYLDGLYHTIILKDIAKRKSIADISKFERFLKFMFANIGNLCSENKIANTLTSMGSKTSSPTIATYLEGCLQAFLFYRAERYDIKGKRLLESGDKYYLADLGLRFYLLGNKNPDYGLLLENVIFLELLRRGYKVYVGKTGDLEIDFVAERDGETSYFQVCLSTQSQATLERELKPLLQLKDHSPMYLITFDNEPPSFYNGIKKVYALDWLLSD